jgi:hypothetical protein
MALKGIYVERFIRTDLDRLWEYTQDPSLHERWDMRFSSITYLPRASDREPQRFLYATRIGFGVRIVGESESIGDVTADNGSRTSRLKFWSDSMLSLIREGSGYWRYIPGDGGIRFLTYYDYSTRFGAAGYLVDLIFRPLIGWATARSFDTLALWLEEGVAPERAGLRPRASRCLRAPIVRCCRSIAGRWVPISSDCTHRFGAASDSVARTAARRSAITHSSTRWGARP